MKPDYIICGTSRGADIALTLNELIDNAAYTVDNLKALPTSPAAEGSYVVRARATAGFGGVYAWQATKPKNTNDGAAVIAPEAIAAWDGTEGDVSTLTAWTGVGNGAWVALALSPELMDVEGKVQDGVDEAKADASAKANAAKSEAIAAAAIDATNKADAAQAAAISSAAIDATTKANAAKSEAIAEAAIDATNKVGDAVAGIAGENVRVKLANPETVSEALDKRVINISHLKALPVADLQNGSQYSVAGFYSGTNVGGGMFTYRADVPWSEHTGGTVIAIGALLAWDGTQAGLSGYLDWAGSGSGCFVSAGSEKLNADNTGGKFLPLLTKMRNGETFNLAQAVKKSDYEAIIARVNTDDQSDIINNVLTDAGDLFIPRGRWVCLSSIIVGTARKLRGAGGYRGWSFTNSITSLNFLSSFGGVGIIGDTTSTVPGSLIEGFQIQGSANLDCAIEIRKGDYALRDIGVSFTKNQGIRVLQDTVACDLRDLVTVNTLMGRQDFTERKGSVEIYGTDHFLKNIQANAESGFTTVTSEEKRAVSLYLNGTNHFVNDCIGEFGEVGIVVNCDRSRLNNLRADRCMGDGYHILSGNNSITNPHAIECGRAGADLYDGFFASGRMNTITGAQVMRQGGVNLRYGINDVVNNNDQKNQWVAPFVADGYATLGKFKNEGFAGSNFMFPPSTFRLPSASSGIIDCAGKTGFWLQYTNPTTITDLVGEVSGQEVTLHPSNGNCTIENNSRIRPKGGITRQLEAHELIKLRSYNGKWYEFS